MHTLVVKQQIINNRPDLLLWAVITVLALIDKWKKEWWKSILHKGGNDAAVLATDTEKHYYDNINSSSPYSFRLHFNSHNVSCRHPEYGRAECFYFKELGVSWHTALWVQPSVWATQGYLKEALCIIKEMKKCPPFTATWNHTIHIAALPLIIPHDINCSSFKSDMSLRPAKHDLSPPLALFVERLIQDWRDKEISKYK